MVSAFDGNQNVKKAGGIRLMSFTLTAGMEDVFSRKH